MTDDASFRLAICRAPEDDTVRLAYADFLEERGDPVRAEYIRAAIELARCGPPHKTLDCFDDGHPLSKLGGRCYKAIAYPEEGIEVGDRIDLLVQRPGKAPKMVHGFRVYKLAPMAFSSRGDVDMYLCLDSGSGRWKGTELKKKLGRLLDPRWHDLPPGGNNAFRFDRGLVNKVTCPVAWWLKHGPEAVLREPLEEVELTDVYPVQIEDTWNLWGHRPHEPMSPHFCPPEIYKYVSWPETEPVEGVFVKQWDTTDGYRSYLSRGALLWARSHTELVAVSL